MILKLRLYQLAGLWILVVSSSVGVGCSSTSRSRFRAAEGARSVASIGDRPLTTTVGSPGSQVVSDLPGPEPFRDPKARISGRVVDAQGRAISGAVVRLADGMSKAGRDVQTVTDGSGGFTLGNLRPGSSYQLVAEADFGDQTSPLLGRAEADTAEHGVQIRLADAGSQDDSPAPPRSRTQSPKTRSISERQEGMTKSVTPHPLNSEDVGPPADSAETIRASGSEWSDRSGADQSKALDTDSGSNWHRPGLKPETPAHSPRGNSSSAPSGPPVIDTNIDDPLDLDADPGAGRRRPVSSLRDAEVNPLPLALPAQESADHSTNSPPTRPISQIRRLPRARVVNSVLSDSEAVDPTFVDGGLVGHPTSEAVENERSLLVMPSPASLGESETNSIIQAPRRLELGTVDSPTNPSPEPTSAESQSLAILTSPTSSTPGDAVFEPNPGGQSLPNASPVPTGSDPSAGYNPFALVAAVPARSPEVASDLLSANTASIPPLPERTGLLKSMDEIFSTPAPPAEAAAVQFSDQPKAKKWGEVAGLVTPSRAAGSVATASHSNRSGTFLNRRSHAAAAPAMVDAPALCQFNAQTGQLVDFQLPDLDGQPVRFQDFDADYVLFDFWGTWCKPCTDSIPHLIDLQKKYGPNKLKIVGVACEKTSPEKRGVLVAEAAQKLGINYSVLLASMDGTCPVQRDFQVQFYPTMVLVDRRGKVLFRAEGATERNMYRLDQALAATRQPMRTARR